MPIGQHLRSVRKNCDMTLKQLAVRTGLSIGYLSNIERDIVSPTIAVLSDICAALGVELTSFLQPLSPKTPVLKKADRETVYVSASSKVKYESITPNGFRLKGLCVVVAPGGTSGELEEDDEEATPHSHTGDELGIILQGALELIVGDSIYPVGEGDTFSIEANTPHWYKNAGDRTCVFYSVIT